MYLRKLISTYTIFTPVFYLVWAGLCHSQTTLSGVARNELGFAVSHCHVFINGTDRGTSTDGSGAFDLTGILPGHHQLVVSRSGYETVVFDFFSEQLPLQIQVQLVSKTEINALDIRGPVTTGDWNRWGYAFRAYFFGVLENSAKCVIKNTSDLKFTYYDNSRVLTASSIEPLVIENDALGYKILYKLEEFRIDMLKGTTIIRGYSLITKMSAKNKTEENRWSRYRLEAYNGSIMHFMRSLYQNKLLEDSFDVRKTNKELNTEKLRIKPFFEDGINHKSNRGTGITSIELPRELRHAKKDTQNYFMHVMHQPDSIYKAAKEPLFTKQLLTVLPDGNRVFSFEGQMQVIYHKEYYARVKVPKQPKRKVYSYITLKPGSKLVIDKSGDYYDAADLYILGYWAGSERVANLLPKNYKPGD